jgi:hypothetical protein
LKHFSMWWIFNGPRRKYQKVQCVIVQFVVTLPQEVSLQMCKCSDSHGTMPEYELKCNETHGRKDEWEVKIERNTSVNVCIPLKPFDSCLQQTQEYRTFTIYVLMPEEVIERNAHLTVAGCDDT